MATVICPSCGGENNVTKKRGQECAYCGTHLSAPQSSQLKHKEKNSSKGLPVSEEIMFIDRRYSSESGIEEELKKWLVNADNIPLDIFDHLTIEEGKWYYLPMLRFSGNIETEWSCNQIIEKKREVAEKPVRDRNGNIVRWEKEFEYYNEYIPKSGRGRGSLDMLVPCGITTGLPDELKSCYVSIDYRRLKHGRLEDYSNKTSPVPSNAAVCTQFLDFNDDKVLSPVAETERYIAQTCSYGSLLSSERCDEHLTFNQNLHYPTGCLYFVPFVYVVYSYKGDSFEWCFMQDPKVRLESSIHPEMEEGENPMLTMQEEFKKERKQISKRDLISLVVSFFIPPMFGAFFYFLYTHSRTEIAKRRLNEQQGLVSLLFKLKRQENLRKHGYDADLEHNNEIYNTHTDENEAADEDYIDGQLPSTVEGIQSYFAQTERFRKKALKRIRGYWFWFIGIILIIAGAIIGYHMYGNYVQEKALEEIRTLQEEQREQERQRQLEIEREQKAEEERINREKEAKIKDKEQEIRRAFETEYVGNNFQSTGSYFNGDQYEFWRVTFLDSQTIRFEKQIADAYYNLKAWDWVEVSTSSYDLEFDIKENKWANGGMEGTCYLMSNGFQGEIKIYSFKTPVKISNSFSFEKGDKKLSFYKN